MQGARARSGARGIIIGALALAALSACSSGGGGTAAGSGGGRPSAVRPQHIFAAPKGLLSAAQPQANGTMWALAGGPAAKVLFGINLADGSGAGTVPVSSSARSVAESLGGVLGLALGTARTGALDLLDGSTGKVTRVVPIGAPARDVVTGADGSTFYVLNGTAKSASVTIVNSRDGSVQGTVPVPLNTDAISPDASGTSLYALQPNGLVSQIAVAGGKVVSTFQVGAAGRSIALSPDGSTLYVLKNAGPDANVSVVNIATQSVGQVLPAPANCLQVLVSADGSKLYQLVGTPTYGNIQVYPS